VAYDGSGSRQDFRTAVRTKIVGVRYEIECPNGCLQSARPYRICRFFIDMKKPAKFGWSGRECGYGHQVGSRAAVGGGQTGLLCCLNVVAKCVLEVVAFSSCRFKIEHQILHVHAKLAESLLNQVQDSATTLGVFHNPIERLNQFVAMLLRQALNCRDQIVQIDWKLVWIRMVGVFGFHIHHGKSLKLRPQNEC